MNRRSRVLKDISPLGAGVILAVVAAGGLCVYHLLPVWRMAGAGPAETISRRDADKAVRSFADATSRHVAQIDGRSLFFLPDPPEIVEDSGPKPTVYGGPSLYAYVNNTAYFSDGQKLSPSQPESRTLALVKADPPWSVRVLWEGAEFDVELFKRTDFTALRETAKTSSPRTIGGDPTPRTAPSRSTAPTDRPSAPRPSAPAVVNPITPGPGSAGTSEATASQPPRSDSPTPPATAPSSAPASAPPPSPAPSEPAQPAQEPSSPPPPEPAPESK